MTSAPVTARPVVIFRKQFGFRVRYLRVSPTYGEGPLFKFVNRTEQTVEIELPDDLARAEGGKTISCLELPPGGSSETLTVNTALRGIFEYKVTMKETGIEAEGGSRPEIEIEP
jgi:hypothetical protein